MSTEQLQRAYEAAHSPGTIDPVYPNWMTVPCGCCGGVEWGGEPPPRECRSCDGSGVVSVHRSGVVAQYPGGRLTGDRRRECWTKLITGHRQDDGRETT